MRDTVMEQLQRQRGTIRSGLYNQHDCSRVGPRHTHPHNVMTTCCARPFPRTVLRAPALYRPEHEHAPDPAPGQAPASAVQRRQQRRVPGRERDGRTGGASRHGAVTVYTLSLQCLPPCDRDRGLPVTVGYKSAHGWVRCNLQTALAAQANPFVMSRVCLLCVCVYVCECLVEQ
jgi:hypothetical protein